MLEIKEGATSTEMSLSYAMLLKRQNVIVCAFSSSVIPNRIEAKTKTIAFQFENVKGRRQSCNCRF